MYRSKENLQKTQTREIKDIDNSCGDRFKFVTWLVMETERNPPHYSQTKVNPGYD